ncbi:DUF1802 family protein [Anabaena cylindrica FACHB-243]|uniref:DUF1802 domain-containing protein n=1 Tax=Anabaena cylindrica (strain ATCC 27899 / PCC 7122) TaxID=272123 RepID=K9ZFB8_ANACC|nr:MULTISPECIES: DUF1802 family protein [Anabaena]AFZ57886.1 protein of unknown function DUF1802 [Anabaena cylindrica PCC 7122]MBD2419758.1 DUF1802 family protein [Anabaena cylindrica FACHB-243]MBY5281537.1 DUF1802 family protein [Anabaena sp. CCAP 1446/1C]MBY5307209.1 DUF1802 family protein [Anabaena sp. CCAP 1446/1C]MCM2405572.1 DUF1802 family protein [Anabaena sp. CCAP 1446/1C]
MNQSFSLPTALCLPVPDIKALIEGRTIAALPRMFLRPGQRFSLYPVDTSTIPLSIQQYYRTNFLPTAQTAIKQINSDKVLIKAWVRCELCQILDKTKPLDVLSQLTIWTPEAFEVIIQKHENIFLAYLRVYHLPQFAEVPVNPNLQDKLGRFVALPNISGSEDKPVLSDQIFSKRKRQLENLKPFQNRELEELQSELSQIANINQAAQQLENDIQVFLGWSTDTLIKSTEKDLSWIKTIAKVGNSSDGNEFEKLVRKSFVKLGFSCSNTNSQANLDPDKLGGAGGLDFYCEYPYRVVGECKATKTERVPDGTAAQLVKLGYKHLQQEYNSCIKIIMAAGELTKPAELTAKGNQMNVIRPETLQKLVELKAKHPGSIDLLNLKPHLENEPFGEAADDKVNRYIDNIWQGIKLRSNIIKTVRELSKQETEISSSVHQQVTVTEIRVHYNVTHNPKLTDEIAHDLLIELSSPLTGYLGRIKSNDRKTDKFYYLRDLPIN